MRDHARGPSRIALPRTRVSRGKKGETCQARHARAAVWARGGRHRAAGKDKAGTRPDAEAIPPRPA
jgi:hypothetical protein